MRDENRNDELMGMTDLQFLEYIRVRGELDSAHDEIRLLREQLSAYNASALARDEQKPLTTNIQTKLLMASIADILTTSKDLTDASERFKRITDAVGDSQR